MFYCEPCRIERAWPESMMRSRGPCELCSVESDCYDMPSRHLPPSGWFLFGYHAQLNPVPDLEFSKETDPEDGLPLWERVTDPEPTEIKLCPLAGKPPLPPPDPLMKATVDDVPKRPL